MALTDKQKTFAQQLAAGKTQLEAYKIAYNPKTMNDDTIRVTANREANKPFIQEYVNKLKGLMDNQFAVEQTKSEAFIRSIIYERCLACRASGDDTALARYADILNKMDGRYKTITQDLTEEKNPVSTLSTDDLQRLLDTGNMGIAPTDSVACGA